MSATQYTKKRERGADVRFLLKASGCPALQQAILGRGRCNLGTLHLNLGLGSRRDVWLEQVLAAPSPA